MSTRRLTSTAILALGAALLCMRPAAAQPRLGSALPSPRLLTLTPSGARAGSSVEVTFSGTDLDEPEGLLFSNASIKAEAVAAPTTPPKPDPKAKPPKRRPGMGKPVVTRFKVTVPANVPVGIHDVRLINKYGISNPRAFVVGDLAEVAEKEPNNDLEQAQRVEINTTINGVISNPTDVDYYVFAGKKGQRVVVSCLASSIDSRCHPLIELYDAHDHLLANNRDYKVRDALLDCTLPDDGDYYVRVVQFTFTQGTPEHYYRLSITTAPWIDAVYPCAVEAGKQTQITVYGRNLPGGKLDPQAVAGGRVLEKITATVTAPSESALLRPLRFSGLLTPNSSGLEGFEYRVRNEAGFSNPFLITVARDPIVLDNGANDTSETAQEVTIPCEIVGHVEKRRDRDWYTFAAKKGQVLSIEIISSRLGAPTYPYFMLRDGMGKDLFESVENPNFLSRSFFARSEDPAPYRFTVPADGKYQLMVASYVGDTQAGPRHSYRVRIAPEQPDFQLVAMPFDHNRPEGAKVLQGGETAFHVIAWREDGFHDDIALSIEGLPPGLTCAPQVMGGDVHQTHLVVSAAAGAAEWTGPIHIKGTATINGKKVVREARSGSIVWPMQPGQNAPTISRIDRGSFLAVRAGKAPFRATLKLDKDTVVQGDKAKLEVKLERLWPEVKGPVQVQVVQGQQQPERELPQNLRINNNQQVTIAAGKTDGSLNITVGNDVPPGTYNIVLRAQTQIAYNKDPKSKQKPNIPVVQPSTAISFTVLPKQLVTVQLNNANPSIKAGKSAEVQVNVRRTFRYDGDLKVQLVLPPKVTGVQAADLVIPPTENSGKLVVTVPADTKPGGRSNLIVRVTGVYRGKPISQEAKLNVNVVK